MLKEMNSQLNLEETSVVIYNLKMFFVSIFTYYLALKIIGLEINKRNKVLIVIICEISSVICTVIKFQTDSFYSVICLALILSIIFLKFQKKDITYSIMIIVLSLSINYIILFLSILVTFLPLYIIETKNDYIEFASLMLFYMIFIYEFTKIKRFKKRINIPKKQIRK